MKRLILIILLSVGSISLWANNHHGSSTKDISRIIRLLPDNATRDKVKGILGTATFININNKTGEESWNYKSEDENTTYFFKWDNRTSELKSMSYSCSAPLKQNWSNQNLATLEIGASTSTQVIDVLGDPNSMYMGSSGDQWLKYTYADNNYVELQLKGGVLTSIRVSRKKN